MRAMHPRKDRIRLPVSNHERRSFGLKICSLTKGAGDSAYPDENMKGSGFSVKFFLEG